jgi:hypothetical protein
VCHTHARVCMATRAIAVPSDVITVEHRYDCLAICLVTKAAAHLSRERLLRGEREFFREGVYHSGHVFISGIELGLGQQFPGLDLHTRD